MFLNILAKFVDYQQLCEESMEYLDSRVRYTKAVLQQALLRILRTKNIDRISIKELCEEARINRGTFYLHYATPNDVLMEIEDQFIADNMAMFTPYFDGGYKTSYMAALFTGILENRELSQILMGKNGNPRFLERLQQMMRPQVVSGWCREFHDYKESDLNYVYDFIFAGSMRLILNWIEDEQGLSTQDLANRLDRLGHYCHLAIREFYNK